MSVAEKPEQQGEQGGMTDMTFLQEQGQLPDQSRLRLERAARMARLGFYEMDFRQGRTAFWSPELYRIFDIDPEDGPPSAIRLIDIVHPEDSARFQAATESHWQKLTFNFRILTRDGRIRYCHSENERELRRGGQIMAQYGTIQDISPQVEADRRATRAEARLHDAIESLSDGFVLYDSRNRLVMVNQTVRHMFSRLPPRFFQPGTEFRVLLQALLDYGCIRLEGEGPVEWTRLREDAFRNKRNPFPLRTRDGRFYELYNHPTGEGGTVIVAHDITRQKEQERRQAEIESRLAEAHRIGRLGHWETIDSNGDMTWSPNMYEVAGQQRDFEPTYENYISIVHPDDQPMVRGLRDKARSGEAHAGEWRILDKRGQVRWIYSQWKREVDPVSGKPRLFGINQDITARKAVELALRESEEKLILAQRMASLGHFEYLPGRDCMIWSRQQLHIWGLTEEAAPAGLEAILQTVHPEDRLELAARMGERGPASFAMDVRILRPDDELRHLHLEAWRERDRAGKTTRLFGIVQDISENVQRERDLRRMAMRNAFLRAAIEASPVAIAVADASMQHFPILYANQAFGRMSGFDVDECPGRPLDFLKGDQSEPDALTRLHECLQKGVMGEVEMVCYRRDGSFFRNLIELAPVLDDNGERIAYVSVQKDVTLLRQQEDDLRQGQKLEALGRLAGGISHELSNMLQPIVTFSGLALKMEQDEKTRKYLESIRISAGRARDIVRNVLAFSRKDSPTPEAVDLCRVVRDILDFASSVLPPGVEIRQSVPDQPVPACVGETELTQVLVNLLTNAADAMGRQGSVDVALTMMNREAARSRLKDRFENYGDNVPEFWACLSVQDRGVGMDEDTRSRIFDPFFTTKPVGRGTGLGLSVLYGIVQGWGGHIGVESQPGAGARFDVFVPIDEKLPLPEQGGNSESIA